MSRYRTIVPLTRVTTTVILGGVSKGYQPKTLPAGPEGAWARHLDAYLREHNLSASEAFDQWYAELGYARKSGGLFRDVAAGRIPPPERLRKGLIKLIGEPPREESPADKAESPTLTTVLADLARELTALREERQSMVARVDRLQATVDQLVAGTLGPASKRSRGGRDAPPATAG